MRLSVFIARAGVSSRRGADELIKAGRVTVNGAEGQLNTEVIESDEVRLDGKKIELQNYRYILLYKPSSYVTTLRDPQGRKKVTDLINIPERVVPVGRLDFDTIGALFLTNDGELANALMHPRLEVDKVYEVEVRGTITQKLLDLLSIGVKIDDEITAPARAKQIGTNKIELTIHEGRKHQVKKMIAGVGLKVVKLHRSRYAGLGLDGLKTGQWRDLTAREVKILRKVLE